MQSGQKAVVSCLTSVGNHQWSQYLCQTITHKTCVRLDSQRELTKDYPTFTLDIVNGPGVNIEKSPMLYIVGVDISSPFWKVDLERMTKFIETAKVHKGTMFVVLGFNPSSDESPDDLNEVKKEFEARGFEFRAQNFDPKSEEDVENVYKIINEMGIKFLEKNLGVKSLSK